MPVIGISVARLHKLLGGDVPEEQVEQLLAEIGCDVEGVVTIQRYQSRHSDYVIEVAPQESLPLTDPTSGFTGQKPHEVWEAVGEETVVRLDLLPVRPDIFDAGGLARTLRGYIGAETGLKDYQAADSRWHVEVDERIIDPQFKRPLIQCAIVRNLAMDDVLLRAIMRLQENLHWALCRDRRLASIGAYDMAKLRDPIAYTLVDREKFRFTPLFWGHRKPVSPETMLAEHPKGVAYAHLVEGMTLLPALISANGAVLSLPPIINAEETKLTLDTRDVLIDVTGHNPRVVEKALAIMSTSLIELDPSGGATLERVEMVFPDRSEATPSLKPEEFIFNPEYAAKMLGLPLSRLECIENLKKMRHDVDALGDGKPVKVTVAAYRTDIMHEVDLIEDVAIAYGYHNIKPSLVPTFTPGQGLKLTDRTRRAAAVLTGLGFTECMNLILTNERAHYEKINREPPQRRVTLANPVSTEQTMLREHLYSSLLELLALNTDHPLPQKIFEAGDVATYQGLPESEPEPLELRVVAGAICATRAGYADGRSMLDALLREMVFCTEDGSGVEYRADENPTALQGRAAAVYKDDQRIGEVFEVHPQVLETWRLTNAVVMFSLRLGEVEYY